MRSYPWTRFCPRPGRAAIGQRSMPNVPLAPRARCETEASRQARAAGRDALLVEVHANRFVRACASEYSPVTSRDVVIALVRRVGVSGIPQGLNGLIEPESSCRAVRGLLGLPESYQGFFDHVLGYGDRILRLLRAGAGHASTPSIAEMVTVRGKLILSLPSPGPQAEQVAAKEGTKAGASSPGADSRPGMDRSIVCDRASLGGTELAGESWPHEPNPRATGW